MEPPNNKQWQDECYDIKRYFEYSSANVHSVCVDIDPLSRGTSINRPVVGDWYTLKKCRKEECDEPADDQAAYDVDRDAKFGAHEDSFIEK